MKKRTTPPNRNPEDTTLTFQLPKSLKKRIEEEAKKDGRKPGQWVRHFASKYFDEDCVK